MYNKNNTLFNNYTYDRIKNRQKKNNNYYNNHYSKDFNNKNNTEKEYFKDDNIINNNFKTKNKLFKTIDTYTNFNHHYLYNIINKYKNETTNNEKIYENEKKKNSSNITEYNMNNNKINVNNINIGINNNNFIIEDNMNKAFKTYSNSFNNNLNLKEHCNTNINYNKEDMVDNKNINIKEVDSLLNLNNKTNNNKIYINKRNKSQKTKFIYKTEGNRSAYIKKNNIKLHLQYDNLNNDETNFKNEYFLSGNIPQINKLYYKKKKINCLTYENEHYETSNEFVNSIKTQTKNDKKLRKYIYSIYNDNEKENNDYMNREIFINNNKNENDLKNNNNYNYHNKLEKIQTRITDLLDVYNILLTNKISNLN